MGDEIKKIDLCDSCANLKYANCWPEAITVEEFDGACIVVSCSDYKEGE